MSMPKEQRQAWVARGFQDPVKAYRGHAARAGARGIDFKLTFKEWWFYWEPHYEQRGVRAGQKCMCRTGDVGAYEVGNVRIDTVAGNNAERSEVFRSRNLAAGRMPTAHGRRPLVTQAPGDWLLRRKYALLPYEEPEESDL